MLLKIDVPVYETTLISTGKKVKFRPFLVKEQKLFLMASQSEDAEETVNVIKQVLNNCLISKVDIDELPTFDIEYLFLNLRAKSVGEIINLSYICNNIVFDENHVEKKCNTTNKFDLNILEIEPTLNEKHNKKIEISKKMGIVMKYPTLKMLNDLQNSNIEDINTLIDIIVSCVDYIYDENQLYYAKDVEKQELLDFIENLQQDDLFKLQTFFETMPKLKKNLHFVCKKCGYEDSILVEGIQNFFV